MTMQESLSTMAVAVALAGRIGLTVALEDGRLFSPRASVALAGRIGITVAGPGITVAGPGIAGPGITVAGPGIAGPGITVAGPGIAGPDGPCSKEEMPRSCRRAARQIARN